MDSLVNFKCFLSITHSFTSHQVESLLVIHLGESILQVGSIFKICDLAWYSGLTLIPVAIMDRVIKVWCVDLSGYHLFCSLRITNHESHCASIDYRSQALVVPCTNHSIRHPIALQRFLLISQRHSWYMRCYTELI